MKIEKHGIIVALLLFLTSLAPSFAIDNLQISIQSSNVVLSWPSDPSQTYIVQYISALNSTNGWLTLTSSLAGNPTTNITVFVDSNAVQFVSGIGTNGSGDPEVGPPPTPDLMMAAPASGSGGAVPLELFPPGFDLSSYNILDPATGESLSGRGYPIGMTAEQALIQEGISSNSIVYTNENPDCGSLACHITSGTNVAGYLCWGAHSSLGGNYATNGTVQWSGNSGCWIIETVESFNGIRGGYGQGNFTQWFASNAFGGTNYSNTPIGAAGHTEEPGLGGVENSAAYFGLWAIKKNFAICAWNARQTPFFQAIGDPFVTK